MIANLRDEISFLHKLLLTNTQNLKLLEAFSNGSSANIKYSKTQLSKIIQFIKDHLRWSYSSSKIIKKKELINVLADAGFNAADKKIKEKILTITGSGITLTEIEIKDIMKVIRSLEYRKTLLKRASRLITS